MTRACVNYFLFILVLEQNRRGIEVREIISRNRSVNSTIEAQDSKKTYTSKVYYSLI